MNTNLNEQHQNNISELIYDGAKFVYEKSVLL